MDGINKQIIRDGKGASDEIMRGLVDHLIANHLQVDLNDQDWEPLLVGERKLDRPRRVLAIVGAGASVDAGLPLAKEAIDLLRADLHISADDFSDAMERIDARYGDWTPEFETALVALSMIVYPPEKVRNCVQQLYNIRYRPLLRYEILAHLLKHRFIEAVINFNFDELLDQAIADELTSREYHHILHDGDCPSGTNDPEYPYDLPLYIKPHGTASHPSSLKFTHEAYFGIPKEVRRVMANLFSGMPITLLVIGFSMKSPEIISLLRAAKKWPVDIFYINKVEPDTIDQNMPNTVKSLFLPVYDELGGLDNSLRNLWKKISERFVTLYEPRGIERHELVCRVFEDPGISTRRKYDESQAVLVQKYLLDRVTLELAMSAAKAKGLVNMSVLADDRCGRYYDLYDQAAPERHKPLFKVFEDLSLNEIGYSREAYRLRVPNPDGSNDHTTNRSFWIIGREEFESVAKDIYELIDRQFSANNQRSLKANRKRFTETLMYLYNHKEIELRGVADPLHQKIFNDARPIRTLTGLAFETHHILERKDWDTLFVVAETGEWLKSNDVVRQLKRRAKKIYLIVADGSYDEELRKKYGVQLQPIKQLHWWSHNRHMTLLTDGQTPKTAIYFTRRLRSPYISPVILDNEDAKVIFESFKAYWLKARLLGPQEPSTEVNHQPKWIGRESLDNHRFFELLEEESRITKKLSLKASA